MISYILLYLFIYLYFLDFDIKNTNNYYKILIDYFLLLYSLIQ